MIPKFADAQLVTVSNYTDGISNALGIKTAAIVEAIDPNYVYTVVHGIEGDVFNENGDLWSWKSELLKKRADNKRTYETWRGVPNCIGHVNKNPDTDHFGTVVEVYPVHDRKLIDMVIKTDRRKPNSPAPGIESGFINKVSMGCLVKYSTCTACGGIAETTKDYCEHIRNHKQKLLPLEEFAETHYPGAVYDGKYIKVGENCHDSTGVEMSWVLNPAFPSCTAYSILSPKPVDQFKALGSALRWSSNSYHQRAGGIIQKACSKGYLEEDEEQAIKLLIQALRLEDY